MTSKEASSQKLTAQARKHYRTIGHQLKPVVIIAQKGFNDNIKNEIDRALEDHELIKTKILTSTKEEKKSLIETICTTLNAQSVQSIGNIVLLYRPAKKQNPQLSNLLRFRK
ncbi:MAG: ribosome assembly RNA-binding protein YhbY [SAR86 cluster bacterium]|uniref:Ribosome assembly RNA-binding protein YhbY n=1 Tax=SAR86 cluster bacterium TaxID=2030880 RepID=A0A2A4MF95_9GAMM|nr:MAG: ribosome assembly RNA-binding protein YhbY [SAR86 cluster bacterium]